MIDKLIPCYICKCDNICVQFEAQYSIDGRYESGLFYYECSNGHQSDRILPVVTSDGKRTSFSGSIPNWNLKQAQLEAEDIYKSMHNPSVKSKTKSL